MYGTTFKHNVYSGAGDCKHMLYKAVNELKMIVHIGNLISVDVLSCTVLLCIVPMHTEMHFVCVGVQLCMCFVQVSASPDVPIYSVY